MLTLLKHQHTSLHSYIFLRLYLPLYSFILSLNMAGPSNSVPISDLYSSPFFKALLHDNQPNMFADLYNNVPLPYSSLLPHNPLEVNVSPSTSRIHVPTSPPRVNVPPSSLRV